MGVVYYANYLVWFEVARTDWLRASGSTYRQMELDGIALPVVEAHCEYKRPAKYDDEVEIRATGTAISLVRVQFSYEVVRATDHALLATGHTVHASMDRNGRVQRLPHHVRTLFS